MPKVNSQTKLRALEILRAIKRASSDILTDSDRVSDFLGQLGFTDRQVPEYRAAFRYLVSSQVQALTIIPTDRGWSLTPVKNRVDAVYLELLLDADPGASLEELATVLSEIHLRLEMGGPGALTPALLDQALLILKAGIKIFKGLSADPLNPALRLRRAGCRFCYN